MKKLFLVMIGAGFSLLLFPQNMNDLHNEYNKGAQALKAENSEEAIKAFTKCLEMCDKIGTEANEYKSKIEQIYPNLYYSSGMALYKADKIIEAIERFKETLVIAAKYNDEKTQEKSSKVLSQLYNVQGNNMYKTADYDSAINCYNKSLEVDPNYDKALYGKGMCYKAKNDFDNMKASFDKLIVLVGKEDKNAQTAINILKIHYTNNGIKAMNEGEFDTAIIHLKASQVYDDEDLSVYHLIAYTQNKLYYFDASIEVCKKAIEKAGAVESEELSNIYFELGEANMSIGDNAAACEAYGKVISGKNVDKANRQKNEVLKCGQ